MGKNSVIGWTNDTWNPWIGCRKVSLGCLNCYMFRERKRFGEEGTDIRRTKDATFLAPLKADLGRIIFTCSYSDFFLEEADAWRDDAWDVIRKSKGVFLILTKRPERINECLPPDWGDAWDNVWFGVSAEDQRSAEKRMPYLTDIVCVNRFVSAEPLLGRLNLRAWMSEGFIDWLIVGGESGPLAREMKRDWVYKLRDDCHLFDIPFYFKQWGGYKKIDGVWGGLEIDGIKWEEFPVF